VEAQTVVNVRVQVIDLKSVTLDLQVPTYLPARDITQRIARDAGLEAHWPDGTRRLYYLRARGRLLTEDERLSDLGVVNGELVYLLPEPPAGCGVVEQPPEYPETHDYAGAGWFMLFGSLAGVVAWAVIWGVALSASLGWVITTVPGLALGLLCASLARHAWGGAANRVRVAATALVLAVSITTLAYLTPVIWNDASFLTVYASAIPGFILAVVGVFVGWVAWWGAVEPLPPRAVQVVEKQVEQEVAVACAICGQPVAANVRHPCGHGCGRVFHAGCYRAKASTYRGDTSKCAVCGVRVA
jgi:uncharacterized ubiquitin-like protein YukD